MNYDEIKIIAIKLAKGETIDRKDMPKDLEKLKGCLKDIKNNCSLVLRQLKE